MAHRLFQTDVGAQPERGIHTGPVLDVDRSGREDTNGRLYLTWVDGGAGANFVNADYYDDNSDIFLAYSDNHGVDFDDNIYTVEDSSGTDFLPWVDVDQLTGSVNVLYYTTDGDQSQGQGNDDVRVRLATAITNINGVEPFTYANLSAHTSNENEGFAGDYFEYIGLAVHGGTAHALWASRVPNAGPDDVDLEAYYASASLLSVVGDNVLTITGDDGNVARADVITLARSMANADYLQVMVNDVLQYSGLMASVNRIEIDGKDGFDEIHIDANLAVDVEIWGRAGNDTVTLRAKGESSLRSFVFHGNEGDDKLYVDYNADPAGDPLPLAGFEFKFDGGTGLDDGFVVEAGGAQRTAYFVNTFSDGADTLMNGRADGNAAADDQVTLRAAIQEANAAANKTYIFLPTGTNGLSISGTGGASQGDLDITANVAIIGCGPGLSVIDGSSLSSGRIVDVASSGILNLSRVTLATGHGTSNSDQRNGGAIRVQGGGQLHLDHSAIVGNETGGWGVGGGIYFAANSTGSIESSVITFNNADQQTGGLYLEAGSGTVTLKSTIVVNNMDNEGTTSPDIFVGSGRTLQSLGYNRVTDDTSGFTPISTDYVKPASDTVHYIVTSIADTYDGSSDPVNMSLRDAIDLANNTAGTQEIWLPAWDFVLTRQRDFQTQLTDIDVTFGDLDITDSLVLRGIGGANGPATSVAWAPGTPADKVFELVGDYDNDIENGTDCDVDGDDFLFLLAQLTNGTSNLAADGNDDGVVNNDDLTIWSQRVGNVLTIDGIQYR